MFTYVKKLKQIPSGNYVRWGAGSTIEQTFLHFGHSAFDIHLVRYVLLYIDRVVFANW